MNINIVCFNENDLISKIFNKVILFSVRWLIIYFFREILNGKNIEKWFGIEVRLNG